MSYLYGRRATGELTPLVKDLRRELYATKYDAIDWNAARNQCAKEDLYYPHPWYQVGLAHCLEIWHTPELVSPQIALWPGRTRPSSSSFTALDRTVASADMV